jgi:hypothetical protein
MKHKSEGLIEGSSGGGDAQFMTLRLVQLAFCLWPRSRSGITAAFLYWDG